MHRSVFLFTRNTLALTCLLAALYMAAAWIGQRFGWPLAAGAVLAAAPAALLLPFLLHRVAGYAAEPCTARRQADAARERLIERLTTANEQLEQFAHVAAHDIREPLRMVVSFTDLLAAEYGDRLDDTGRQYMAISREAACTMNALVSDLLEYACIDREAERCTVIDGHAELRCVLDTLADSVKATGAQIDISTLPRVLVNPMRFARLLQNLIGNALKYQPPGRTPKIAICAEEQENQWCFAVSDNGIGIKAEYLDAIFQPFKRLHNRQDYTGTGIGLAVCKKIVEGFGGTIWAESAFGEGTTMYFTIPKRKETDRAA